MHMHYTSLYNVHISFIAPPCSAMLRHKSTSRDKLITHPTRPYHSDLFSHFSSFSPCFFESDLQDRQIPERSAYIDLWNTKNVKRGEALNYLGTTIKDKVLLASIKLLKFSVGIWGEYTIIYLAFKIPLTLKWITLLSQPFWKTKLYSGGLRK